MAEAFRTGVVLRKCLGIRSGLSIRKERFMARIPQIMLIGEPTAYHIMYRTALDGYPMDDVEKDFFGKQVDSLKRLTE
jgi:hypothetical protein